MSDMQRMMPSHPHAGAVKIPPGARQDVRLMALQNAHRNSLSVLPSDSLLSHHPHHRFSCQPANGEPLQLPTRPESTLLSSTLQWSDVAFGMMVGQAAKRPGNLEYNLLIAAHDSWMQMIGKQLSLVILADCRKQDDEVVPAWLANGATDGANLEWRCYRKQPKPGVTLWRKTWMLLRLLDAVAAKAWYLKIDEDTLLMPRSLLQYLRYLHETAPRPHVYFGNDRVSFLGLYDWRPTALFQTTGWHGLLRRYNWTHPAIVALRRQAPWISYAAGGFYGFDRGALELVSRTNCMDDVATTVTAFGEHLRQSGLKMAHMAEDEVVGLCMHASRVRLISCDCFYQYGPCNCNNFTSCNDGLQSAHLCRLPLSVHKLKKASWYAPWWRHLTAREAAHLAELQ